MEAESGVRNEQQCEFTQSWYDNIIGNTSIFQFLDLKIVVLGGGGVGKSSFIYRYIHNDFKDTLSVSNGLFLFLKFIFCRLLLVHMFPRNGKIIIFLYG